MPPADGAEAENESSAVGDKVTYNGQHYVCTSDANVYAPDVYGWQLA